MNPNPLNPILTAENISDAEDRMKKTCRQGARNARALPSNPWLTSHYKLRKVLRTKIGAPIPRSDGRAAFPVRHTLP